MKKKIINSILILSMIAVTPWMNSCNKDEATSPQVIEATDIQLSETSLTIAINKTATLTATVSPENAADKSVTWTSTHPAIAEVSADGTITAKAKGQTNITATTKNGKTAICQVTVIEKANLHPDAAQYGYMVLVTEKAIGERIALQIFASPDNQAHIWIDLNNDGEQQPNEKVVHFSASSPTLYTLKSQTITVYGKVRVFNCDKNKLTSLETKNNLALRELSCAENQLTSLAVNMNQSLEVFFCESNQLQTLDVSNNTALWFLDCSNNQLTALDVSKNKVLVNLACHNNQIKGNNMQALLTALPQRQPLHKGNLHIKDFQSTTEGNDTPSAVQIQAVKEKNWTMKKQENNQWIEM